MVRLTAAATGGYLAAHASAGATTAVMHGFTVAMDLGAVITLAAAVPVAAFVNAPARRR